MKILIVDDQMFNLKMSEHLLKSMSDQNETLLCQQPLLVDSLLEENEIDIILLDIVMPKITGTEILKQIRGNRKYDDIQIIMLTSIDDSQSIRECFDSGANEYILKPINIIEFQARVNAAMRARKNSIVMNTIWKTLETQNVELKQINQKLKDAQFHLIQSEKMAAIGELAAGVVHEINNPIGYVGSNFETLSSYIVKLQSYIDYCTQQIDDTAKNCPSTDMEQLKANLSSKYNHLKLDFITEDLEILMSDSLKGMERVSKIVRTLRNFARRDSNEQKEICSLVDMIQEVLLIVRNEAKYSVDFDVSEIFTSEVWCHKGQIGQVLLNIVMNAIQAINSIEREEFGLIKIRSYENSLYTCIDIIDDGPGMPAEIKYKIFNPFFTTKETGKGTGLGLSISYDIVVNKHKGELNVVSEPGQGTKFTVKLPKKTDETEG